MPHFSATKILYETKFLYLILKYTFSVTRIKLSCSYSRRYSGRLFPTLRLMHESVQGESQVYGLGQGMMSIARLKRLPPRLSWYHTN